MNSSTSLNDKIDWVNNKGEVVHPETGEIVDIVHGHSESWSSYVNSPTRTTFEWILAPKPAD